MFQTSHNSIHTLKASIRNHWGMINPAQVVNTGKVCRSRVERMLDEDGDTLNKYGYILSQLSRN